MEQREFQYEDHIKKLLDELITKIGEVEAIEEYKKIARKVDKHQGLKDLVEEIKRHQKDAVQFAHYEKFEAEKEAIRLANEKQHTFDEHPLVIEYREKLIEANDLLQHVTSLLEEQVNESLEEGLEK